MQPPTMKNKGGNTMFFDSTLIVTFGNISNSGNLKVNAVKDGKKVEWAKKVINYFLTFPPYIFLTKSCPWLSMLYCIFPPPLIPKNFFFAEITLSPVLYLDLELKK